MINETLNNLFAQCQQLPDEDLNALLSAVMREQKERDCKKQKAAWIRVCEAINDYIANYGNIRVADYNDGNTVVLEHGCFTYSQYGDIEVGA